MRPTALVAAVALFAVWSSPAEARRECPWSGRSHEVTIEGNHVVVDGVDYLARGFGRNRLERDMRACEAGPGAAEHLEKWRRKRRNAWITGSIGAVFLWPVWVVTGVQIHGAVKNKKALETTLEGRGPEDRRSPQRDTIDL